MRVHNPDQLDSERSNLDASDKEADAAHLRASKQLEEVQRQEEYNDDDDEDEKVEEDTDTDVELEAEEMDDLENLGDTAGEGLDDMDEDEDEVGKQATDRDEVEEKDSRGNRYNHEPERLSDAVIGNFSTLEEENEPRNSSRDLHEETKEIDMRFSDGASTGQDGAQKSLQRLGGIKTIPRWDPLEDMGSRSNAGQNSARNAGRSFLVDMNASRGRAGIIWDHLLGVARRQRTADFKGARKFKFGGDELNNRESMYSHQGEREGAFSNSSSSGSTQIFSSDDEPLDEAVAERLEGVTVIEDALLLKTDKSSVRNGLVQFNKGDTYKKDRASKAPFDPLNPVNNPLLQDPDTFGPNGLTRSDKFIWKALRTASIDEATSLQERSGAADDRVVAKQENASSVGNHEALAGQRVSGVNVAERAILGVLTESTNPNSVISESQRSDATDDLRSTEMGAMVNSTKSAETLSQEKVEGAHPIRILNTPSDALLYDENPEGGQVHGARKHKKHNSSGTLRRWGHFPGLDPFLTFSEFLEQFLMDSRCSLRVFMAWTTPPWTYTVRYQRGLESLLYFHPHACVVVFSETIELNFFKSFVEEGYKVAVVMPNLEELLEGTPADVFASIWLTWKKIGLFHIHYTELLRLAALYKYGGIYIDTDVIILKPLDLPHNTVGAETMDNHTQRLNGAVMAFDRFSPFLLDCIEEFAATYDDQLSEFNGAGLLTRVADRIVGEDDKRWKELPGKLKIRQPYAFFPLNSSDIRRYFIAPVGKQQQWEQDALLKITLYRSVALHFWNQRTSRLVPEVGSLVERLINYHCIRCHEYL